ncbi:MAG: hypothetical protein M1570_08270 [Chloroflexi bacterium]|nr:hypothetical protein [Chloroflexota bacterium]
MTGGTPLNTAGVLVADAAFEFVVGETVLEAVGCAVLVAEAALEFVVCETVLVAVASAVVEDVLNV